jgi:hypothetical protein
MGKTSMSAFFRTLSAPLVNSLWSWGAINQTSGDVIFRVWVDEHVRDTPSGKRHYRLTNRELYSDRESEAGYRERLEQLEIARSKGRAFFVICYPVDAGSHPRSIANYKKDRVGLSQHFLERDGDWWLEETTYLTSDEYAALTS